MGRNGKTRVLITKLGLDTHVVGAKVVAYWLRDAGMEVTFLGKYQTPEMVVKAALEEDVDVIGISCLALSYEIIIDLVGLLKKEKMDHILVIAGGTMSREQATKLKAAGVSEVFFPDTKSETIIDYITSHVKKR